MLCDLIFSFNFTQVITAPSNVKGGILDLLITHIQDNINIVIEIKTSILSSDHFIITFYTNMTHHIKKTTR